MRAVAIVFLTALAMSPAASQPNGASVLAESPFSASERSELLAGRTVVQALEEAGNRKLAGATCVVGQRSFSSALSSCGAICGARELIFQPDHRRGAQHVAGRAESRTVVITGAAKGIGRALAR